MTLFSAAARSLRIAMVHTTLPNPSRPKEGGVTYYVHRLANKLVDLGHEVTVFSADGCPPDGRYHVRPLPAPVWATSSFLGRMLVVSICLNRLHTRQFDVVHTHGDDTLFFSRRRLRSLHGSALGEMRSATRWRRRIGQAVLYPAEVFSALTAARCVAQSEATRRDFPFVKTVIPYAVDTKVFFPGEKSPHPTILFVGTIAGRKRGALLVEAFESVIRPEFPGAELWLVAERPIESAGVRNFGRIEREEDLAALYRSAWVFCLPSSYEGLGLPYLEALASGTAVVSTRNPGAREALNGAEFGIICEDSLLGQAINQILSDPEGRASLEAAGLGRASAFSWDDSTARFIEQYRELANEVARRT